MTSFWLHATGYGKTAKNPKQSWKCSWKRKVSKNKTIFKHFNNCSINWLRKTFLNLWARTIWQPCLLSSTVPKTNKTDRKGFTFKKMFFGSKEIIKWEEHKVTLIDYFNTVFIYQLFFLWYLFENFSHFISAPNLWRTLWTVLSANI